jgi:hypothetical protein
MSVSIPNQFNTQANSTFECAEKLCAAICTRTFPYEFKDRVESDLALLREGDFSKAILDGAVSIHEIELNDYIQLIIDASKSSFMNTLLAIDEHVAKMIGRGWYGYQSNSVVMIYGQCFTFDEFETYKIN